MRIEKNFYDEAHQEYLEMEKEIQSQKNALTDEEREQKAIQMKQDATKMFRKFEEENKYIQYIPNAKKIAEFQKLSALALAFAQNAEQNILIESKERNGHIKTTSGGLIINSFCPPDTNKVFTLLLSEADDVWIGSKNGLMEIDLWYGLCDEINGNDC